MSYATELPVKYECKSVRVCRGCLATDGRLYNIRQRRLEQAFVDLTGLTAHSSGLLCCMCLQLLHKFSKFREHCLHADGILKCMHPLTEDVLNTIDRSHLKLNIMKTKTMIINCDTTFQNLNYLGPFKSEFVHSVSDRENPLKTESLDNRNIIHTNITDNDDELFDMNNDDIVVTKTEFKPDDADTKSNYKFEVTLTDDFKEENEEEESYKDNHDESSLSSLDYEVLKIKKPTSPKKSKESLSNDKLILEIRKLFMRIFKGASNSESDLYNMFELLYKESFNKNLTKENVKLKKKNSELENIKCLLGLYKQATDNFNIAIEFCSVSEQQSLMDERRKECTAEQCRLCCKNYLTADTFQRHMNMCHNENHLFRCVVCHYTFKKQSQCAFHILKVHVTKKTCKECGLSIGNNKKGHWLEVRKHMDSYHKGDLTHCEYCGRSFRLAKNCYVHIREMHRGRMNAVQCLLCGDTYNGPVGLRNHVVRIHTPPAVKCVSCAVYFSDAATLATHTREPCTGDHGGCPLCGATFPTEQLMKEHYDDTHAKYKCDKCGLTFVLLNSYKQHCLKLCRSELSRVPKVRVPRGPRGAGPSVRGQKQKKVGGAFICDVCGKEYDVAANLRYHQRIHTGEKPYKCEHCDKTFRTGTTLLIHSWTHSGERRYKCKLCPKAFRQSGHLKAHMPSHTNEKNYPCTLCSKRFTSSVVLRQHLRTVHEGLSPVRRVRKKHGGATQAH